MPKFKWFIARLTTFNELETLNFTYTALNTNLCGRGGGALIPLSSECSISSASVVTASTASESR